MRIPALLFFVLLLFLAACTEPLSTVCADCDTCQRHSDCAETGYCDGESGHCTAPPCDPDACADGETCAQVELCDGALCETHTICRTLCEGSICGISGELCCEGSTPECGPGGQCAPSCEGLGELCGEHFDTCCPTGNICVFGDCRPLGPSCSDFTDCDWGEYCDPGLGRCMSDDFPDDIQCRAEGDFLTMEVTEKWSWTDEDIISIPVVGDVTGDGSPNVVVNAARVNGQPDDYHIGQIVILDAQGTELRRIPHDPVQHRFGSQGRANIALADVTGDGKMEIIYLTRPSVSFDGPGFVVAVNGEGNTVWRAHTPDQNPVSVTSYNGAITVANLDDDPTRAEIVVGAMIIDSDGVVRWNEGGDGPTFGSNAGYLGGIALVADVTGDGKPNIITGNQAWTVDWPSGGQPTVSSLWSHAGPDGYPAIADIDGNNSPEVILVADGTLRILDGATGKLWCGVDPTGHACEQNDALRTRPIALPGSPTSNRGGPPTVADFDGDGRPEIGVAGGYYYTVFDINRPAFAGDDLPEVVDSSLLSQFSQPTPASGEIYIRWMRPTQDLSSNTTGSSVFDFQGDGIAEVVYADECFLRVYSGVDGEVQLEVMNSTGTILEYPLVVDVDENGRSEILVVSNDTDYNCSSNFAGYQTRQGLHVYEDPNDRWVRTRSIWNQHAYSIDNILDDGSTPITPPKSWQTHNTFRNNRQGEVPLNAADVVVSSVQINALECPPAIDIRATIQNQGIAAIASGLPVTLYDIGRDQPLETIILDQPLSPGATAVVTFSYEISQSRFNQDLHFMVAANDDGTGTSLVYDCRPDSATLIVDPVQCRIIL